MMMSERREAVKAKGEEIIKKVSKVKKITEELMVRAESFGRDGALRSREIPEIGMLLGKNSEVVAMVLGKFLNNRRNRRHREAALLVLAHPEFDLYYALSSEDLIHLRDQVAERVFWMAKNDRAKWVTGWAGVLASKLGFHPEYNEEGEKVNWAFQERVKKLGWAKELKKNIPPLRELPFLL